MEETSGKAVKYNESWLIQKLIFEPNRIITSG